ncbi:MAG: pseudouridine synthase [Bacteroidota bacterium]
MKYDWSILYETAHCLAINKPSSLNVEPIWDYPNVQDQVINYLRQTTGRQSPYVGIVHRLDRPVSGVLLLAKKKSALRLLNEQFAQRQVNKTYWAVCADPPPAEQDKMEHHLIKEQKNKRSVVFSTPRKGSAPDS